ncbi:MAG: ribonuclease Z [Gemmatimonadales bacterium]|jgi:ribonuclease BN (tRNA processing enzyme)
MELTVIGSGTVAPTADRVSPAYWLETEGIRLLLDCGAGTLHRCAALAVPWHTVTHVAITHFHPDHWAELPTLVFALRWGTEPARREPLVLLGPTGLRARLDQLARGFGAWLTEPEFPLDIVELAPDTEHRLGDEVALETCKTPHTDESLAYAVRRGATRLVYTGDTGESDAVARFAAGCDLLLAECSLPDERAVPLHLSPGRAGRLATAAGTKRLVLTHFYPVFGAVDPAQAAAAQYDGDVVAARDGDRFSIGE